MTDKTTLTYYYKGTVLPHRDNHKNADIVSGISPV